MRLSTFATATDVEPTHVDVADLRELYYELPTLEVEAKEDAPLWSPAEYRPAGRRRLIDVARVHALVLDVDHADVDAFAVWYFARREERFWYSTFGGYGPDAPLKVRVAFALSRPVSKEEWPKFWTRAVAHLRAGEFVDPTCCDATRMYYAPSRPVGAEEERGYNEGVPLDVDSIMGSTEGGSLVPEMSTRSDGGSQPRPEPPSVELVRYDARQLLQMAQGAMLRRDSPVRAGASLLFTALRGKAYAEDGDRERATRDATFALAVIAPDADPATAAALFDKALAAMPGTKLTIADVEDRLRRAQEKVRAERAAAVRAELTKEEKAARARRVRAPEGELDETFRATRLLIHAGGQIFVYSGGGYLGPYIVGSMTSAQVRPHLEALGVACYKESRAGRTLRGIAELLDEHGSTAERLVVDATLQRTEFDGETMRWACSPRRPLVPNFHDDVDAWLRELAGDAIEDVRLWLGAAPDLTRPIACLFLEGAPGAGKSSFARGVSRIWSDDAVPAESAMSFFNDALARCPIVFADEALPRDLRGNPRTAELRRLVQETSRPFRRKHVPESEMRGAVRVIVAANRADVFYGEDLTLNDQAAIAERVYRVAVHDGAARFLRALPYERRMAIVQGDAIAEHALFLSANVKYTGNEPRFLVESKTDDFHREQTVLSPAQSAALHWMVSYLRTPVKIDSLKSGVAHVRNGELFVSARALTQYWSMYETNRRPPTAAQVSSALAALAAERIEEGGEVYWRIDSRYLYTWAAKTGFCSDEAVRKGLAHLPTEGLDKRN